MIIRALISVVPMSVVLIVGFILFGNGQLREWFDGWGFNVTAPDFGGFMGAAVMLAGVATFLAAFWLTGLRGRFRRY